MNINNGKKKIPGAKIWSQEEVKAFIGLELLKKFNASINTQLLRIFFGSLQDKFIKNLHLIDSSNGTEKGEMKQI